MEGINKVIQEIMYKEQLQITLHKDKEWHLIDSELCLVADFQPLMGSVVSDGEAISPVVSSPYAEIKIVCKKATGIIAGLITHKEDFINLRFYSPKEGWINKVSYDYT